MAVFVHVIKLVFPANSEGMLFCGRKGKRFFIRGKKEKNFIDGMQGRQHIFSPLQDFIVNEPDLAQPHGGAGDGKIRLAEIPDFF